VERPQLTTSALKKGLEIEDDLLDNFFEAVHFMDMCLKFKHKLKAVIAPHEGKVI
jgi:hypothetical protein